MITGWGGMGGQVTQAVGTCLALRPLGCACFQRPAGRQVACSVCRCMDRLKWLCMRVDIVAAPTSLNRTPPVATPDIREVLKTTVVDTDLFL